MSNRALCSDSDRPTNVAYKADDERDTSSRVLLVAYSHNDVTH